jgi:hypothetical protein
VLGNGEAAIAAGGLRVESDGLVVELDNFSGTFQFGEEIFEPVKEALKLQGATIQPGCERRFLY